MPTDAHRAGVQAQAAERALKQADGSSNMPAWSLKDAVASRQQKKCMLRRRFIRRLQVAGGGDGYVVGDSIWGGWPIPL